MEVVLFAQETLQSVAEYAVSYRLGQTVLRQVDRVLWTIEKSALWAVPPPLDQDDQPQPELIRPLPWVFFLALLIVLRVIRESMSLLNLVLGKPPLRSTEMVTYIQGKRRYLRTLKYQGNRMMRARGNPVQPRRPWYSGAQSLFELTMCFRRQTPVYSNNNTSRVSNNDEVLVVKRNKRGRQEASLVASTSETSMERLIEKMMVDLQADSDDDCSYTLTNPTSGMSDQSDIGTDSGQETSPRNDATPRQSKCQINDSCQVDSSRAVGDDSSHSDSRFDSAQTDEERTESESARIDDGTNVFTRETQGLLQNERDLAAVTTQQSSHGPIPNGNTVKQDITQ